MEMTQRTSGKSLSMKKELSWKLRALPTHFLQRQNQYLNFLPWEYSSAWILILLRMAWNYITPYTIRVHTVGGILISARCVCIWAYVHMCTWRPEVSSSMTFHSTLFLFLFLFWGRISHCSWSLPILVDWLTNKSQRSSCLHHLSTGIKDVCMLSYPTFSFGCKRLNSGLHACIARAKWVLRLTFNFERWGRFVGWKCLSLANITTHIPDLYFHSKRFQTCHLFYFKGKSSKILALIESKSEKSFRNQPV